MIYSSYSQEETLQIAEKLAHKLKKGDVVALSGELGAGKTVFVKGLTKALGSDDVVSSPTFTLVNEYEGEESMIYHFDVYRISGVSVDNCDWIDEYLFSDGICIIEWAENLMDILPDNHIRVNITKNSTKGEEYREIEIC